MSVDDESDDSEERTIFGGSPELDRKRDAASQVPLDEERTHYKAAPERQSDGRDKIGRQTRRPKSRFAVPEPGGAAPNLRSSAPSPPPNRRHEQPVTTPSPPTDARPAPEHVEWSPISSEDNHLISRAANIFALGGSLRTSPEPTDINQLREHVLGDLHSYRVDLEAQYPATEHARIHSALFALCAYIDESVMSTIWGKAGRWEARSVLGEMFGHNQKNEVFDRLDALLRTAPPDLDLLEFYYVVLSTGFLGRFGGDNGRNQHRDLRDRIYETMRSYRPDMEATVGVAAAQIPPSEYRTRRTPPPFTITMVTLVLVVCIYSFVNLSLATSVDQLDDKVQDISSLPELTLERSNIVRQSPTIPAFNFVAVSNSFPGLIEIYQGAAGVRIIIKEQRGIPQFESGSALLSTDGRNLLASLAQQLTAAEGRIYIEGHTDHIPFAIPVMTNKQLSRDRASTVAALFQDIFTAAAANASRIKAIGRGGSDPLVCPDRVGWEINRRVEIRLPAYLGENLPSPPQPNC